jgi:formylglycine-generating enzyme required for sulfatase activity
MMIRLFCALTVLSAMAQQRDLRIEVAPQRKALLIGNNRYPKQALANAVNDATDLSAALKTTGFQTELVLDADLRTMDMAVQRFVQTLNAGDVALFYFSGHGIGAEGENFLLPVSFAAESEADIRYQAYSAARVRDLVKSRNVALSILILDACRSNPFRGTRSGGGGLVGMGGAGAFIAFAADEGKTADDNPNERNGLFTKHLLSEIRSLGVGLESLFTRVRAKVYAESKGRQTPFSYSGLLGDFYFLAMPLPANPPSAAPPAPFVLPPAKTPATDGPAPAANEKRLHSKDGLNYIYIPSGPGVIGCSSPGQCAPNEQAARPVHIAPGFWIGETEVTRGAYEKVMGSVPALQSAAHLELAAELRSRLPVTDISPVDAQQYCRKVGLYLPTEFQWEFAARAGAEADQPQPIQDYAWLSLDASNTVSSLLKTGEVTRLVAQKKPNAWGLYDMIGNAAEFAMATGDSSKVVVRGGSFVQKVDQVKIWRRSMLPDLETTYMDFGFRCAGPNLT